MTDISVWEFESAQLGDAYPGAPVQLDDPDLTVIEIELELSHLGAFEDRYWIHSTHAEAQYCSEDSEYQVILSGPSFSSRYIEMCEGSGCTPVATDRLTPIDYSNGNNHPSVFLLLPNRQLRLSKEVAIEPGLIGSETRDHDLMANPNDICAKLVVYHGLIPRRKETQEFVIAGELLSDVIRQEESESTLLGNE